MENPTNPKPMDDERLSTNGSFEESGWTMYFEDFFATTKNNLQLEEEDGDHDQHHMSSSSDLISDAASLVAKNSTCDVRREEEIVGIPIPGSRNRYSKLSFKKRRTKGGGVIDNALEDTASSPVHSPKVYDLLGQSQKNTRQQDRMDISHQEKGNCSSQINDRSDLRFKENTDTTELKKRGLCLVPLSMVVNYIG